MKEKGIEGAVEKEKSNPLSKDDRAATPSPLGQIPCLITDDGVSIYDLPVIMEYLDVECDGPVMLPRSGRRPLEGTYAAGPGRRHDCLNGGVLRGESEKPERQSGGILAHNKTIVFNGIAALEGDVDAFAGDIDVGTISVAVALAFADQTFPEDDWRTDCPALAAWFG